MGSAVTAAVCYTGTLFYTVFGEVEPMVSVRPAGKLIDVYLSGVVAPVKTSRIQHEGVRCLEKYGFHVVVKTDSAVLSGSGQKKDPTFTFVSDSMDHSDVTYVKFAEACLNCKVGTDVKYKDFFGFEKEKRLPWF